jgi:hypothetical protein
MLCATELEKTLFDENAANYSSPSLAAHITQID